MHKVNRLAVILIAIASMLISAIPAYATDTGKTVSIPNRAGTITFNSIDIARIDNADTKVYEATAPVIVNMNNLDLKTVNLRYYKGSQTSYFINSDGSASIILGNWDQLPVHSKCQLAKEGLYRIQVYPSEDTLNTTEIIDIYIYVTVNSVTATPTTSTVVVNGKVISFDAYNINGNNYFKLRDIADVLSGTGKQFEVTWDHVFQRIHLTSNKPYTPVGNELTAGGTVSKQATPTASEVYSDNNYIYLAAYNIDGYNYFKLRDLAAAINFGVTWTGNTNTVDINTSTGYTA